MSQALKLKILLFLSVALSAPTATAGIANFHGKVIGDDGSAPGRLVAIQRTCPGAADPVREANTSAKTGEYFVHIYIDPFGSNPFGEGAANMWLNTKVMTCYLEAALKGYASTHIEIDTRLLTGNPELPDLVLTKVIKGTVVDQVATAPRHRNGRDFG